MDPLEYLRKTDALMAEGIEFNRNWQDWLSSKGYPFDRVAEQSAAIDRACAKPSASPTQLVRTPPRPPAGLRARMHVILSTAGHTNQQVKQGILPSHALYAQSRLREGEAARQHGTL